MPRPTEEDDPMRTAVTGKATAHRAVWVGWLAAAGSCEQRLVQEETAAMLGIGRQ
jgi:hypothetical protein